jgi:hypothetical protein
MARRAVRGSLKQLTEVAHQVDFRVDAEFYAGLLRLAGQVGLVRADGTLRVAELVRVLLISTLWQERTVVSRAAIAVYCNVVLALSGQLATALAGLRTSIATLAEISEEAPLEPALPRLRQKGGPRSSILSIVFDDLLRRKLSDRLKDAIPRLQQAEVLPLNLAKARPTPDVVLVRGMLRQAVQDFAQHRPVIIAYAGAMQRVESGIREAVANAREAVESALQEV